MDGVKRNGIQVLGHNGVNMNKLRSIWPEITQNGQLIDKQVEINAHYAGYLLRQSHDIAAYKKDESILIPEDINYKNFSGLSNEIKFKLTTVKPKTLGQALRIDGVTPAAAILLLGYIKKHKRKVSA
jgi:tRNA uridine 5-carboxymethylaminomethyl modification enzyme